MSSAGPVVMDWAPSSPSCLQDAAGNAQRSRARAQRRPRERAEVWAAEPGGAHAPRRVAEYTYQRSIWRWAAAWGPTL